jgi:hypothetical protein
VKGDIAVNADRERAEKAARYRAYAVEAEQRVAWQTDVHVASVYRSVVRAWTRLADELERVPLPAWEGADELRADTKRPPDGETALERLRRRAAFARELAAQVPDAQTRKRLLDYAARLEAEVAALAHAGDEDR